MYFSIKYKILLTLVAAIIMVVGGMWLLTQWSFERGLSKYVSSIENEVQANLARALAQEYRDAGGWESLRGNPRRWHELQFESVLRSGPPRLARRYPVEPPGTMPFNIPLAERGAFLRRHPGEVPDDVIRIIGPHAVPLPPPPHGIAFARRPAGQRLLLLDRDRQPVVGHMQPGEPLDTSPIVVDGDTVGFLAVRPNPPLADPHELHFSERQAHAFMLIALVTLAVAALLAWPISRQLVKPIRSLSAGTRQLAAGRYDTRISVAGRDELGQLARDFNSLAKTLEENEKSRRQWIADISHELRTPLAILQGEIEAMQDGVRQCTPERLASLHGETLNLARLVNDLYELSLSDIGALSYQKQRTDLAQLLEACLGPYREEFASKNIELRFAPGSGGPVHVFGDPARLQQLFSNLLGNSLRYTDPGGAVEIALAADAGHAMIDVRDSRPGVPPEHLPRLFERLYRVDPSRSRSTGGAGLGLAICRNIVEAHDGRITAQASPLGGLWVHVDLPLDA